MCRPVCRASPNISINLLFSVFQNVISDGAMSHFTVVLLRTRRFMQVIVWFGANLWVLHSLASAVAPQTDVSDACIHMTHQTVVKVEVM